MAGKRTVPKAGAHFRNASRRDDGTAFIPDPGDGRALAPDDLAESLAEEFVESVTGGDAPHDSHTDERLAEEVGGPFVFTTADQEFADGVDASNPRGSKREAMPRPNAGLVVESSVLENGLDDVEDGGDVDEDEDDKT